MRHIPLPPPVVCAMAVGVMVSCPSPGVAATAPHADVWTLFTSGNEITSLATEQVSHGLWAATTGGVVHWSPATREYTKYTAADGLAGNWVNAVAIDPATGDKWFGTGGGGVSRLGVDHRW